jgi:hypothetical protein
MRKPTSRGVPRGPAKPWPAHWGRVGEQRWLEGVYYQQSERVPVNLLAVWEVGQEEPWYLVSNLPCATWVAELYRWRMRIECTNRDTKSGLLLRQGGDQHHLTNPWHLHTLGLTLACAEWWHALLGLQAWQDLPTPPTVPPLEQPLPSAPQPPTGPALPPPVVPHRGATVPPPRWMRPFTARGWLSYVRLGFEVSRVPALYWLVHRMVVWVATFLAPFQPLWRPWQRRYRRRSNWLLVY